MNFIQQMINSYSQPELQALLQLTSKQQQQLTLEWISSPLISSPLNSIQQQVVDTITPKFTFNTTSFTPQELYQQCQFKFPNQTIQTFIDLSKTTAHEQTSIDEYLPAGILHLRQMTHATISALSTGHFSVYDTCQLAPDNIGCIATRNISIGEVVFTESPLLSGSMIEMNPEIRAELNLSAEQTAEMLILDTQLATAMQSGKNAKPVQDRIWNIWVDCKVNQLQAIEKMAFWSLHDSIHDVHQGDMVMVKLANDKERFALVLKQMETCNEEEMWQIKIVGTKEKDDKDNTTITSLHSKLLKTTGGIVGTNSFASADEECAVYQHLSRFNHACIPNIKRIGMNDGSGRVQAIAMSEISIGSEMYLCYCRDKEKLKENWKFDCTCFSCKASEF